MSEATATESTARIVVIGADPAGLIAAFHRVPAHVVGRPSLWNMWRWRCIGAH